MKTKTKAELARELAAIKDEIKGALAQLHGINVDRKRLEETDEKTGRYDGHYAMAFGGAGQLVRNIARAAGIDDDETKGGAG